jgi:hypothetical protein
LRGKVERLKALEETLASIKGLLNAGTVIVASEFAPDATL